MTAHTPAAVIAAGAVGLVAAGWVRGQVFVHSVPSGQPWRASCPHCATTLVACRQVWAWLPRADCPAAKAGRRSASSSAYACSSPGSSVGPSGAGHAGAAGRLGPRVEVALQVADQMLLGRPAGGLDLDQPSRRGIAGADQQVGRLGTAEILFQVHRAQPRGGQHRGYGGDQVVPGAVEQAVPHRLGVPLGVAQLLLEECLLLDEARLQLGQGSHSRQLVTGLQVRIDEMRRACPAQHLRRVRGQRAADQPAEQVVAGCDVRDDVPLLAAGR
jgi:hypothetical protein